MSLMPRLLSPSKKLIRYTLSFTPSSLKQVSRDINFNNDLWFILILYSIKRAFIMHKSYNLHSGRKSSKKSRNIENWIWIPNVFRLVCLMSKLEQVDVLIGFCYYIYTWCWTTILITWFENELHIPTTPQLSRQKKYREGYWVSNSLQITSHLIFLVNLQFVFIGLLFVRSATESKQKI